MIHVTVCFSRRRINGTVAVRNGKLAKLHAGKTGRVDGETFALPRGGRLEIELSEGHCRSGSFPTLVTIHTDHHPFSFNLRDVRSETPVWIPEFAAAVVPGDDKRTYDQIEAAIRSRNLRSDFERFDAEPEWSYEQAARLNRAERCPTWLGLGRDIRMFRVHPQESFPYWGIVQPFFHDRPQSLPDQPFETSHYELAFVIGHGSSCRPDISRRIEEGALPILRSVQREPDLEYHFEPLDRVFALHRLEGEPMPDAEMAVLVQPGAKAVFDMLVPHSPLTPERAAALMRLDVETY